MIFLYMIIVALPTAALTKGADGCNITVTETNGTQKCFVKFGESLTFHLLTNEKLHLKKSMIIIFKINKSKLVDIHEDYRYRSNLVNATFTLDKLTNTDSGNYQLEIYNHDGKSSHIINVHVEVQVPVSQPEVSQLCLSPEQMTVSCSTEGDGVEVIWSLDGNTLIQTRAETTDKQLTSQVTEVTISLHGQLTGYLACMVTNKVSSEQTGVHLTSCTGSICHPPAVTVTVSVIASVAILLLLLALFPYIRRSCQNPKPVTVTEDNTENEIVYSDVRMKPARKTRPNIQ